MWGEKGKWLELNQIRHELKIVSAGYWLHVDLYSIIIIIIFTFVCLDF